MLESGNSLIECVCILSGVWVSSGHQRATRLVSDRVPKSVAEPSAVSTMTIAPAPTPSVSRSQGVAHEGLLASLFSVSQCSLPEPVAFAVRVDEQPAGML